MSILNLTGRESLICFDFETGELQPDGTFRASTEAYRPAFRVMSCAFTWFDDEGVMMSAFVKGEDQVREALVECGQTPLLVFNLQFETMVTRCRYPDLTLNLAIDAMRLAQVYDNGGDKNAFEVIIDEDQIYDEGELPEVKKVSTAGLGLVKCAFRILGKTRSHKETAHRWIRENFPKSKGKEGQFLDRLPDDILRTYNISDTETTLELYKFITDYFKEINYDWSLDHELYKSTAGFLVDSKIRGVLVDRDLATKNQEIVTREIAEIELAFSTKFSSQIADLEQKRLVAWIAEPKTEKGRLKRQSRASTDPKAVDQWRFNPGSNAQLARLFMEGMGLVPKLFTAKGAPSFKSSHLDTNWGEPGLMLQTRRKRMIVLKQITSLLGVSNYDGRWRIDIRAAGTVTGRLAAGSGNG